MRRQKLKYQSNVSINLQVNDITRASKHASVQQTCCVMSVSELPGLGVDDDLGRVECAAGEAGGVDGAQRGGELHHVRPDEALRQQARVLARS